MLITLAPNIITTFSYCRCPCKEILLSIVDTFHALFAHSYSGVRGYCLYKCSIQPPSTSITFSLSGIAKSSFCPASTVVNSMLVFPDPTGHAVIPTWWNLNKIWPALWCVTLLLYLYQSFFHAIIENMVIAKQVSLWEMVKGRGHSLTYIQLLREKTSSLVKLMALTLASVGQRAPDLHLQLHGIRLVILTGLSNINNSKN